MQHWKEGYFLIIGIDERYVIIEVDERCVISGREGV